MIEELVSIVLPTYNSKEYIATSMESLLQQTYRNIEIIVVDDGSADETVTVCRQYESDTRVKIIEAAHLGVSTIRNLGIENSHGKYLMFMDSDDFAEKNMVEKCVNAMHTLSENGNKVAWVMTGMQVDVLSGTMKETRNLVENCKTVDILERNKIAYLCWKNLFNFITNKMYNLELLKENNIRFYQRIQIAEDLLFNIDYLKCVNGNLGIVNEPLYHYVRRSADSLSLIYYPNAVEHTKQVYRTLRRFVMAQKDVVEDDMLVIESLYLTDWTSRITAMYSKNNKTMTRKTKKRRAKAEISSEEFQLLLDKVYSAGKISKVRYKALKMESFPIYYFLRWIYRFWKMYINKNIQA